MVGLLFYTGWSGTLFVVDISGGEGSEEQIMWIFGESTSQAKEEPVGGP